MARKPHSAAASGPSRPGQNLSETPASAPGPGLAWALAAAVVAYLAIFLTRRLPSPGGDVVAPSRGILLLLPLTPEELWRQWFGGTTAAGLAERLPILGLAALILGTAWAVGSGALRALGAHRQLDRLERAALALPLGLQCVSLLTLALGLASALGSRWPLATMFAAAWLAAALSWWRSDRQAPSFAQFGSWSRGNAAWLVAAMPFALVLLLGGMLPPIDFDVLEYHLEAPKEFYLAGRVEFLAHNVYGNMPLGCEMHALAAMVLAQDWWLGALAGKTVIALMPLATALVLAASGRRLQGNMAAAASALVYLSIPWVGHVATAGLIDCGTGLYLAAALLAVILWHQADDATLAVRRLLLAGLLAGGAVSTKYPGLVFVALPMGVWIAATAQHKRWRSVTLFGLAVAASAGLWFAKNLWLTGNPCYPLLYGVFGGATRTPELNAQWMAAHSPPNFALADLLGRLGGLLVTSDWQSPLLWPLVLLALVLAGRSQRAWRPLAGYLGAYFLLWWALTHRIDRFWVAMLPVAALLAGLGASAALARRGWRGPVVALVAFCSVWNFLAIAGVGFNRYGAPLAELRVAPERLAPWRRQLIEAVRGSRVLAVGDAAVFDFAEPPRYNTVFDASTFVELVAPDGKLLPTEELAARLESIDGIYVDWGEIARYRSPGNYGFPDFVQPAVFAEMARRNLIALDRRVELPPSVQLFRVVPRPARPAR